MRLCTSTGKAVSESVWKKGYVNPQVKERHADPLAGCDKAMTDVSSLVAMPWSMATRLAASSCCCPADSRRARAFVARSRRLHQRRPALRQSFQIEDPADQVRLLLHAPSASPAESPQTVPSLASPNSSAISFRQRCESWYPAPLARIRTRACAEALPRCSTAMCGSTPRASKEDLHPEAERGHC